MNERTAERGLKDGEGNRHEYGPEQDRVPE
jgi:hypothetical protein